MEIEVYFFNKTQLLYRSVIISITEPIINISQKCENFNNGISKKYSIVKLNSSGNQFHAFLFHIKKFPLYRRKIIQNYNLKNISPIVKLNTPFNEILDYKW